MILNLCHILAHLLIYQRFNCLKQNLKVYCWSKICWKLVNHICIYGLPQWSVLKNPSASAKDPGDTVSVPGLGRSPGGQNGHSFQYSCLENLTGRGAWWPAVHGVAGSRTRQSDFTFTFHFHALEKEMATHSSILSWRIPGTEEPSGLPSMRSTESDTTEVT